MTVPFAFANLSGNIALAKLDSNFNTPITIGNTSVLLGNTITTINNVTLANVTISSGTASNISLTSPLAVSSGGTGSANLTVNNVLIGNGTSAVTSVAPGTTGNVLTSIGGAWVSNVALTSVAAGANTQVQYNSANLLAGSANLTFDGTNLGLAGGTANGVAYLNGSKVLTTGSALVTDGSSLGLGGSPLCRLDANGTIRSYGLGAPATGVGTEISWDGTSGSVIAYNRTASTWQPMSIGGSYLAFLQSGSEGMRLTSTGLGIGTSSPSNKLVVSNAGANGLEINPNSGVSSGASLNGYNRSTSAYTPVTYTALSHYFQVGSSPATAATLDSSGNLGIGTTANASAILDAQSTTKGVRMPNMTTTQKNAISSPAAGLMVFDTTLAKLCVYSGSAWQTITSV